MFIVDEKLTSRVFRLHSHKLHKQRLTEIKSKFSTRINNSVPRTLKFQQIKRTGYISQVKEHHSNINRENEKIFQTISQISEGKRGSSIQYIVENTRTSPKPKSLNLPTRKKEAQRIIEDNYALAKRLSESTRGVSFKKFDEDWLHTAKYMDTISRRNLRKLPKIDELPRYLPSFTGSEIGSKKMLMKSPILLIDPPISKFSPNFTSPLLGLRDVSREEKGIKGKNESGSKEGSGILRKEISKKGESDGMRNKGEEGLERRESKERIESGGNERSENDVERGNEGNEAENGVVKREGEDLEKLPGEKNEEIEDI